MRSRRFHEGSALLNRVASDRIQKTSRDACPPVPSKLVTTRDQQASKCTVTAWWDMRLQRFSASQRNFLISECIKRSTCKSHAHRRARHQATQREISWDNSVTKWFSTVHDWSLHYQLFVFLLSALSAMNHGCQHLNPLSKFFVLNRRLTHAPVT